MNNNFKLILFLFVLSKISLKKYFINLDLLRTNSQCGDKCIFCQVSPQPQCRQCTSGYCLTNEGICEGNE